MYKLLENYSDGKSNNCVLRLLDAALVPLNAVDNADYQQYLAWLSEGNTPEPADEGS